jgi:hypothetical protein
MPARQDQTLQIFLIIFIFAFLVSAVVAYLGWRGYSEADARAVALDASLKTKTTEAEGAKTDLEDMRQLMGVARTDTTADAKKTGEADMKTYGSGIADEASRTYRKVLETVYADLMASSAREAKQKAEFSEQAKTLLAVKSEAQKQMEKSDDARKKAEEDAASQRNAFAEFRRTLEKAQGDVQKSLDDQRTNYEGQITKNTARIKELEDQITKLARANRNLIEQRKDEPGSFEVADGRISWVNQNGTVWINLGTGDSLRRQVTFSVFDADQHDAAKAAKKGSIEVTRLLDDHMAEARITKDDPTNPILNGDNIYSQVWHRGKKLHFALTGLVDIDGDGVSDMQQARDLIELNGGIVDAYLKEDGKMEGEITANTRYLVLGDVPDSAAKSATIQGYHDMSKTASSLGVQTITLPQFIDQMGFKPQDRTVHLGTGAKAHDFPPRPENGNEPTVSAGGFRVRPAPATRPVPPAPKQ